MNNFINEFIDDCHVISVGPVFEMTNDGLMVNGYKMHTTFWYDFSIAERFGVKAVSDTFDRAFKEWKHDYKYLTELVMVLNWKMWDYYKTNEELAEMYNELWLVADYYARTNLKDEELTYFYVTTD